MDNNAQTTSHEGLRAWFELLRTSREGLMPKYQVDQVHESIHCSYTGCRRLDIGMLKPTSWVDRQQSGTNYLFAFRHSDLCPWMQHVDDTPRNSFTTKPLERAYVYWAQFEHKFNHIHIGEYHD